MTTLRTTWVCEFCHENTYGENPPDICDVCGGVYFDNGQDLANERGVVPSRTRPVDFEVKPEYVNYEVEALYLAPPLSLSLAELAALPD